MSDKFGDGRDPYFWSGIHVLRNRLDIREAERLQDAELAFTALRAATIELGPARMGLPWLCAIHQQLFQDIFDWAGELREVDIYQGETRFCHFEYIERAGNELMQDLEDEHYLTDLRLAEFIPRLAHYYCEINMLHPFRIGSGRAQRIFFEQLAMHAGYVLDWRDIDPDAWQVANQAGALGDLKPLTEIFIKVVSEARESD